jgi:aminobenzoyl-glutamate utilization protein B
MIVAAKTLALTLVDLFADPSNVAKAREEFDKRRGERKYVPRIGDRKPPLDYRKI